MSIRLLGQVAGMDKAATLPPDQVWELNEIVDLAAKQAADEKAGRAWDFDVKARLAKIAQKLSAGSNVKKDLSYALRNGYRADPEAKAEKLKLKKPMMVENQVKGEEFNVRK